MKSTLAFWILVCATRISFAEPDQGYPKEFLNVGFGFSDQTGNQILRVDSPNDETLKIPSPSLFKTAACSHGKIVSLKYKGKQPTGPSDNGRDSSYNFDQRAGDLYDPTEPIETEYGEDCFLFSDEFMQSRKVFIPTAILDNTVDEKTRTAIEKEKNRKIKFFWNLVRLDDSTIVSIVQFENKDNKALLSLVAITPSKLIFQDNESDANVQSQWRVDDGGEFDPSAYRVGFAYKSEKQIGLGIFWYGAEGDSMSLLESNGNKFEEVANGYLYQSPL